VVPRLIAVFNSHDSLGIFLSESSYMQASIAPLTLSLRKAQATFDHQQLTVTTGQVKRVWRWTGGGLLTQSVTRLASGYIWQNASTTHVADWQLPTRLDENPDARLVDADMTVSDDEGFTSEHLLVSIYIDYPSEKIQVRFSVRVYPDAPGLHVQLAFRTLDGFAWDSTLHRRENTDKANTVALLDRGYRRAEFLPLTLNRVRRRAWGFYNNLQHRNDTYTAILEEHVTTRPFANLETCDWANAMCIESGTEGIALLKESHRCVNQLGIDGGVFAVRPDTGLEAIGLGVFPYDLSEKFITAWAHWTVVYADTDRDRQIAFKQFDRARYPMSRQYAVIQANTWGSSMGYLQHRDAAGQENVLRELQSCAELGIDLLQIDDGWQGNSYDNWEPCRERYPDGWGPVTHKAEELGVKLGLWCAGERIDLSYLQKTFDEVGFLWYKLDFMNCTTRKTLDELLAKVRAFELYSKRNTRVNWDTTEVCPRLGYFLGREYGAIYYANRKPVWPPNVVYRPHTVLRDLWELSTYLDLRQILGDVQNPRKTNPVLSNAQKYSATYCAAITLMSLPTFFMETRTLDQRDRQPIAQLLAVYKQHRDTMLQGMVHPIGSRPDGSCFTGFQCHNTSTKSGYLTLFRELDCSDMQGELHLVDLSDSVRLRLTNLLTNETIEQQVHNGQLNAVIQQAPDFRFYHYEQIVD
jgi:hypothetical protein